MTDFNAMDSCVMKETMVNCENILLEWFEQKTTKIYLK